MIRPDRPRRRSTGARRAGSSRRRRARRRCRRPRGSSAPPTLAPQSVPCTPRGGEPRGRSAALPPSAGDAHAPSSPGKLSSTAAAPGIPRLLVPPSSRPDSKCRRVESSAPSALQALPVRHLRSAARVRRRSGSGSTARAEQARRWKPCVFHLEPACTLGAVSLSPALAATARRPEIVPAGMRAGQPEREVAVLALRTRRRRCHAVDRRVVLRGCRSAGQLGADVG